MLRPTPTAVVIALASVVVWTSTGSSAPSSQAPPAFESGVDVVQLDVTVLDAQRQPVTGLTADDFTVVERGAVQPIVSFSAIDLPSRPVGGAAWRRDVAPDVASNHLDTQRVVIVVMDDCHISFDPGDAAMARRIAARAIDELGPADMAAVVHTASRRQGQEFTTDKARLRAAVERFSPRGGLPPPHPFAASRTAGGGVPLGAEGAGPCPGFRPIEQMMANTAEALRGWSGWRKTLLFISPFTPVFRADAVESVVDAGVWGRVFDAMQEANVTVYQFDPRGLEVGADITRDLGALADATGGTTIRNTNLPEDSVAQVFRENRSYYMIGFQPVDTTRDGRFRSIEVRVNRPGLTVRTRSGYFAPQDARAARSNRPAPPILEQAIAGALPSGDLPLDVAVVPFARPGSRQAAVAVVAGFSPVGLAEQAATFEVLVTAFRDDWKNMGSTTQRIEVVPRSAAGLPLHVDLASRLELPPGRYEIRTAVTGVSTGRTGSAYASVVVPDFRKAALALSGVAVQRAQAAVPGAARDLADVAPVAPTTVRAFTRTDGVSAFVQIVQSDNDAPVPVDARVRLVDAGDVVRFDRVLQLDADDFAAAGIADVHQDIPLRDVAPGEYLLVVGASSTRGADERRVRLRVY